MMNRSRTTSVYALVFAALLAVVPIAAQETAPRPEATSRRESLQRAMAEKLKCSQSLLTGLAIEDFVAIADNAVVLKRIGESTLTKVAPDLTYIKYSTEFTSLADDLARRAKEKDLNGATVAYIRLTINCVECHKHLRDGRVPDRAR